jgi:hypothetical protein
MDYLFLMVNFSMQENILILLIMIWVDAEYQQKNLILVIQLHILGSLVMDIKKFNRNLVLFSFLHRVMEYLLIMVHSQCQ